MSTNYYLVNPEDEYDMLHIGKRSSSMRKFLWHSIPEMGLFTQRDWFNRMDMFAGSAKGDEIRNEYGETMSVSQFRDLVESLKDNESRVPEHVTYVDVDGNEYVIGEFS